MEDIVRRSDPESSLEDQPQLNTVDFTCWIYHFGFSLLIFTVLDFNLQGFGSLPVGLYRHRSEISASPDLNVLLILILSPLQVSIRNHH